MAERSNDDWIDSYKQTELIIIIANNVQRTMSRKRVPMYEVFTRWAIEANRQLQSFEARHLINLAYLHCWVMRIRCATSWFVSDRSEKFKLASSSTWWNLLHTIITVTENSSGRHHELTIFYWMSMLFTRVSSDHWQSWRSNFMKQGLEGWRLFGLPSFDSFKQGAN